MNKRTRAWVLLLTTGLPTPALWRDPNKSGRTGSEPSSGGARVTVTVKQRRQQPAAPTLRQRPQVGWLSDDPDVARWVGAPAPPTPPAPRVRRQTPRKAAPASQEKAPAPATRAPRTRAEKAAAERAAWPSSWDQLASGWDRTPGS